MKIRRLALAALLTAVILLFASCASAGAGMGRDLVATEPNVSNTAAPAEPAEPTELTVVMVGDVLLHETVSESGAMADGSYNYDHLFANVRDKVESADLAIVNQELILGGRELGLRGYPRFNGAYEVGDAEAHAGFDVILHSTNHALDMGGEGILNCLGFWRAEHPDISVAGIYDSAADSEKICICEVAGIKIAVLNYTYSTNGVDPPADMPWAVAMLDESKVEHDFALAREQADFIIVCPHWGVEYSHEVSGNQRAWADYFAELGADVIIGTHPHVIEPVETLAAPDGRQVPVFWSLGNFINATAGTGSGTADRMVGAMAEVTVDLTGARPTVKTARALPLVTQMVEGRAAITTYFLSDYTDRLAAQNGVIERDPVFSLEWCRTLVHDVLGEAAE